MLDIMLIEIVIFVQTDSVWFDWRCTSYFDGNELSEHGDEYHQESRVCEIKSRLHHSVFVMDVNFEHDV